MAAVGIPGAARAEAQRPQSQFIEAWIIPHGGDCCGCAVSRPDGSIICNECSEELNVLVSEVAFRRMAEALQRAHHALASTSGLMASDGAFLRDTFFIDHTKELRFIDETLKLARVDPRPLEPLP